MKKTLFVWILIIIPFIFCACSNEVMVSMVATNKLRYDNIENCSITKLCDLSHLTYDVEDVTISDEELDECISVELEQYEKLVEITDRNIVKKGDYITISYISKCNGKIIDKNDSRPLKVGAGNFDIQAEKYMVGAKKGVKFTVSLNIAENVDKKELSGKKEIMEIEVLKISRIIKPKITDKWVRKKYGYSSVEAFYNSIKNNQLRQKEKIAKLNAKEKILTTAIKSCTFNMNNNAVLNYAKKKYYEAENAAHGCGISIEEYVQDFYDMNIKEYYQYCYDIAESDIKEVLFIGACSNKNNIVATDKNVKIYIESMNVSADDINENDYILYEYEVLKNKVIDFIVEYIS